MVGANIDDKAAIAKAAAMGEALKAAVDEWDREGVAAKTAVADFEATTAEPGASLEDSDDEPLRRPTPVDNSDLATRNLERLEQFSSYYFLLPFTGFSLLSTTFSLLFHYFSLLFTTFSLEFTKNR